MESQRQIQAFYKAVLKFQRNTAPYLYSILNYRAMLKDYKTLKQTTPSVCYRELECLDYDLQKLKSFVNFQGLVNTNGGTPFKFAVIYFNLRQNLYILKNFAERRY